ncbi:MAG: hypothetical protein ACC700_20875, partial [Anaerolineales bacterium]
MIDFPTRLKPGQSIGMVKMAGRIGPPGSVGSRTHWERITQDPINLIEAKFNAIGGGMNCSQNLMKRVILHNRIISCKGSRLHNRALRGEMEVLTHCSFGLHTLTSKA